MPFGRCIWKVYNNTYIDFFFFSSLNLVLITSLSQDPILLFVLRLVLAYNLADSIPMNRYGYKGPVSPLNQKIFSKLCFSRDNFNPKKKKTKQQCIGVRYNLFLRYE